jgi:hypothetical protein
MSFNDILNEGQKIPFNAVLTTWICYSYRLPLGPRHYMTDAAYEGGHVYKLSTVKENASGKS